MREIAATVSGHTIRLSDNIAGASGGYKTATIVFGFDTDWDNCDTISLYFTDAKGRSSVFVTLGAEDIVDGNYQYAIPAEPLKFPGQMIMTIRGMEESADPEVPSRIIMTAKCEMTVLDSGMPAGSSGEATPVYAVSEELFIKISSVEDYITEEFQNGVDLTGDITFAATKGVILTSDDGTKTFKLTVNNDGYLIVTQLS